MENLTNHLYAERDACGVGFVAESAGARFDRALPLALTALKRLEHRGAVHADGRTGDGAGVLTAIPRELLRPSSAQRDFAVAMLFLPRESEASRASLRLLEETLVVLATEFGRTPTINQNAGRDHYPRAFSCLLAGGGIRGGQIYGRTDATGGEVDDGLVEPPNLNATIAYALGLPLKQIVKSASRRPFTVANKAAPITELF